MGRVGQDDRYIIILLVIKIRFKRRVCFFLITKDPFHLFVEKRKRKLARFDGRCHQFQRRALLVRGVGNKDHVKSGQKS